MCPKLLLNFIFPSFTCLSFLLLFSLGTQFINFPPHFYPLSRATCQAYFIFIFLSVYPRSLPPVISLNLTLLTFCSHLIPAIFLSMFLYDALILPSCLFVVTHVCAPYVTVGIVILCKIFILFVTPILLLYICPNFQKFIQPFLILSFIFFSSSFLKTQQLSQLYEVWSKSKVNFQI